MDEAVLVTASPKLCNIVSYEHIRKVAQFSPKFKQPKKKFCDIVSRVPAWWREVSVMLAG